MAYIDIKYGFRFNYLILPYEIQIFNDILKPKYSEIELTAEAKHDYSDDKKTLTFSSDINSVYLSDGVLSDPLSYFIVSEEIKEAIRKKFTLFLEEISLPLKFKNKNNWTEDFHLIVEIPLFRDFNTS